jgi:hypothetical protein
VNARLESNLLITLLCLAVLAGCFFISFLVEHVVALVDGNTIEDEVESAEEI